MAKIVTPSADSVTTSLYTIDDIPEAPETNFKTASGLELKRLEDKVCTEIIHMYRNQMEYSTIFYYKDGIRDEVVEAFLRSRERAFAKKGWLVTKNKYVKALNIEVI
ncbi:MAG: hypothetical protein CL489_10725 [Acidobacteria bacterium]|nr:hypothetical protein [Acidobacteriota bacterium]|tara:strand:+ start:903 stop:1223 length:321 start_codon:yes stop_codon:yes gene_type:complete